MKTRLLVLQPTPFCNIDCRYCYLPDRNDTRQMSIQTVANVMKNLSQSQLLGDKLAVIWHAGEPLTVPLEFYRDAFETIEDYSGGQTEVTNYIQTNATLVSNEHCSLFLDHDVKIGISVDGPRFLHDSNRVDRKGRGTFDAAMRGLNTLRRYKIEPTAITVVRRETLKHAEALYEFYFENGLNRVGFNIEEIEGPNKVSSLIQSDGIRGEYLEFIQQFLELCDRDNKVSVREFDRVLRFVSTEAFLPANCQNAPLSMVNVDVDGNFSSFSPELVGVKSDRYANFILGNVRDGLISESSRSALFQQISREIDAGVKACAASCDYFPICGGGAPSNKFFENGSFDSTETGYCRITQKYLAEAVFSHYESKIAAAHAMLDAL